MPEEQLNKIFEQQLKKFLRLSMPRERYSIPQAAFRLNMSVENFEQTYVETGKIKLCLENGQFWILQCAIDEALGNEDKFYFDSSENYKEAKRRLRRS